MSSTLKCWHLSSLLGIGVLLALPALAAVPVVKTVPWDPTNPTLPHTTYPLSGGASEVTIWLVGTWQDPSNSGDAFQASWDFGDGSPSQVVTNKLTPGNDPARPYDAAVQHQYPVGAAAGTTWTAVLTVTDTKTGEQASANVYVIQETDSLKSRTNVAIANGLWYEYATLYRTLAGTVPVGGWDGYLAAGSYDTGIQSVGLDASNVLAFEVQGHKPNGPASDPYTEVTARGVQRLFQFLNSYPVASKTYNFSGSGEPSPVACAGGAACTFTFDGNSDTRLIYSNGDAYNQPFYQGGMVIDAITAAGTPAATAMTGPVGVNGLTFQNIVQNMIDGYNYCQSPFDPGGAWTYGCDSASESHVDDSVSQWAAIGQIAANRVMGIGIPSIVVTANNEWMYNAQTTDGWPKPTASGNSAQSNDMYGAYIYANDWGGAPCLAFSNCWAWGPFADTPSGMVQLAMDGVGRTSNTLFGDATTNPDQRFNYAETFYRDNFCNNPANGYTTSPKAGVYGMLSLSKSMRLHNPGGVLSPITMMRSLTPGVSAIDWYNAVGPESGGADACDGWAQTLVKRQGDTSGNGGVAGNPDPNNAQGGFWFGHGFANEHSYFETGWTIQILTGGVFVACVNNLTGRGTAGGRAPARIDLTWTDMTTPVSRYDVYRANAANAPYSKIGSVSGTSSAYSDTNGLVNGNTYYYELHAVNAQGVDICVSNAAQITVP